MTRDSKVLKPNQLFKIAEKLFSQQKHSLKIIALIFAFFPYWQLLGATTQHNDTQLNNSQHNIVSFLV
jgi:hypothetical protein